MSFFKTTKKTLVYENQWMKVYENEIVRGLGKGKYSTIERGDSVIVLPVSPSGKTVLLMQHRYPTGDVSWESPMGGVGVRESPHDAAERELFEETHIRSGAFKEIGAYYPVPGLTNQRATVFLADVSEHDLESVSISEEEDEIGGFEIVALSEVFERFQSGGITDGFTIAGLLFLKMFLERTQDGLSS